MTAIQTWKAAGLRPAPSANAPSAAAAATESRALADRYDDLAKRIDGLKLTSDELLPRAQRYQKLAREAAAALRDVAQAVEQGDATKARNRRVEFDDLARAEGPLVAEINRVCR